MDNYTVKETICFKSLESRAGQDSRTPGHAGGSHPGALRGPDLKSPALEDRGGGRPGRDESKENTSLPFSRRTN